MAMRLSDLATAMSSPLWVAIVLVFSVLASFLGTYVRAYNAWETPGCHRLGYQMTVAKPNCVPFEMTTNACRGYCTSYATPSYSQPATSGSRPPFTTRAECCAIMETHDIEVSVLCTDEATGRPYYSNLTFKSAASCECTMCRWT